MANYQEQKERDYQNALVKRFQEELGYTYLGNWQYAKGATVNNMGVANSPILDDEIRSFLKEQGRTEMQIEDVLVKLKDKARLGDSKMSSLIQCNTDLYDTLIMGIKSQPSPEENHEDVMFFDFDHPQNNHFAIAKHHIDILKAKQEEIESLIQEMTEEHEDDFNGYDKVNEIRAAYKAATCKKPIKGEKVFLLTLADMPSNNKNAKLARNSFIAEHQDVFAGWEKFNKADIKRRIGEIENYHPLLPDTLAVFKEYLDKYDELTSLKVQIKELTTTLTNKVVEKYASLTEDEIRTLVVERKWLATVIGGCMALMQSVTHRIGTEVASLVERYENTLPELTKEVSEYENEGNGYLAEMGFTL